MYIPLTLFFLSLLSIILMVRNKLELVKNGQVVKAQHAHPFVPEVQKIKHLTFKNGKKFGYVMIFVVLKFFIKSSNFIKIKSKMLAQELENRLKNKGSSTDETKVKKEVSKYLKIISEYRHKIRQIKHKIKEEEGIK